MYLKKIIIILLLSFFAQPSVAQGNINHQQQLSLPSAYFQLRSDTEKMQFLAKAISDSLDDAMLDHVLPWAQAGLTIATQKKLDSMQGIFQFFIGKAFTYRYNLFDSAILHYKKALGFFNRNTMVCINCSREIMERYADLGKRDSAIRWANKVDLVVDSLKDSLPVKTRLYQSIALVYQGFGMNRTAISYYDSAISNGRKYRHQKALGMALANLGELYNQTGHIEKAVSCSKEALQYLQDVNMPYMQTAGNICDYYLAQKNVDSALVYLRLAEERTEKTNDFEVGILNNNRRALMYTMQKNFGAAKKLFDNNLAVLSGTENLWSRCITLINYAVLDSATGMLTDAKRHLEEVVSIGRKNNFPSFLVPALRQLSVISKKSGDYVNALTFQEAYTQLKDSLADEKTKAELADLEVSYKTMQKENEIQLLKKENQIKKLDLENNKRSTILYVCLLIFVITLLAIIYQQRIRRNKIETEKLKAELQSQVLRTQMNPHFIFNSLNSIENFIMQNEKRLASDYLNKFARLIRMILDSSRNEVVSLEQDMEALQLYIDLEQLRFNNKFSCHTDIDPVLLNGDYKVPCLLVQPYVENAIVHGLAHSEKNNLYLSVSAVMKEQSIIYTIEDNGIGRKQAETYKIQNKPYHKSVGLAISEARINNLNRHTGAKNAVVIADLYDDNQMPAGTKVTITINAA